MPSDPRNPKLAREAKAIVALAFRNGPIEQVHGGKFCPVCKGNVDYSHITDDEMKKIMKSAVDCVYRLLCLKDGDSDRYEKEISFGERNSAEWDEPEEPSAKSKVFHRQPPP